MTGKWLNGKVEVYEIDITLGSLRNQNAQKDDFQIIFPRLFPPKNYCLSWKRHPLHFDNLEKGMEDGPAAAKCILRFIWQSIGHCNIAKLWKTYTGHILMDT